MLGVAFVGAFAARLHGLVRDRPRRSVQGAMTVDETAIVSRLADLDVLVTLMFTREMGGRAGGSSSYRYRPPVGPDRAGGRSHPAWLANAYGHEIGIAES